MTNKIRWNSIFRVTLTVAFLVGCGGARKRADSAADVEYAEDGSVIMTEEAIREFEEVSAAFSTANKVGWTPDSCSDLVKRYERIAKRYGSPDAAYNAGVVQARCGDLNKAEDTFKGLLKRYEAHLPTRQRALAYLAYIDLSHRREADAEEKLRQAVGLGRNTLESVPAYTMAATILRERAMAGDNEAWAKAQTALRTALAIDATYMPALYQLARLYYGIAVTLNRESFLTLATLVVDQAQKTDPEFAPIYLVLGQILLHRNQLVEALRAFEVSFQKDANLYEAYMSFAAINLNFRGYSDARKAFERAIALRPESYDAHIGMGVAARGLGDYALARTHYQKASEIDKARTDYIFNLGVLEMDYENSGSPEDYEKAAAVFETFIKHATPEHHVDPDGRGPELSWVEKAKRRIENARKSAEQIREAERVMAEMVKMAAEQAKREAEMERLAKQAEELAKKEAEGASAAQVDEKEIEAELAAAEKRKADEAVKSRAAAEKATAEKASAAEDAKRDDTPDVKL